MNHDMHVATGMDKMNQGVDVNAGTSGEKGMPGSEIGGMNQEKSMRMNNAENFATGANSGMENGMGYGTMAMKDSDGMGGGMGMGGNNMDGIDMRMYMGTIKRSTASKNKHVRKQNMKTS